MSLTIATDDAPRAVIVRGPERRTDLARAWHVEQVPSLDRRFTDQRAEDRSPPCGYCDGTGLASHPTRAGQECAYCNGYGYVRTFPLVQLVRPVIVTLPDTLGQWQVLVHHHDNGVTVNVREHEHGAWVPSALVPGVTFEVRDR